MINGLCTCLLSSRENIKYQTFFWLKCFILCINLFCEKKTLFIIIKPSRSAYENKVVKRLFRLIVKSMFW